MVNLMGYSVLIDNEEQAKKLQEIAFEQDFEWRFGYKKIQHLDERSFQFGLEGKKVITFDSGKVHYQDEHITKKAHFNDLFKVEFVPTAMKCTQEQFEAIKPKLIGFEMVLIDDFTYHKYLVNNAGGVKNIVTNISRKVKSQYNREVYEEWNEELFLKNSGIIKLMEDKGEQLRKEAKRRGYTKSNFECLVGSDKVIHENIDEWYYEDSIDTLFTMPDGEGGYVVYKDGVWAKIFSDEIVSESLEQQLERAEAEVERLKREIKYRVGNKVEITITEENREHVIELLNSKV